MGSQSVTQLSLSFEHLFASGLLLPLEVIGIVTDVMTDVSLGPVSYPIRQPTTIFQVMVGVV